MIGIFFFEMLGTAAITFPASILYWQATLQAGITPFAPTPNDLTLLSNNSFQIGLLYMCMIYFSMLLIATPISGGHFNPALTFSVFLTCNNKKDKIAKLLLMFTAQLVGGLIAIGWGRAVRI